MPKFLEAQELYEVISDKLNVRNQPSTRGAVIGSLKKNDIVEVTELLNGWAAINYRNRKGYVARNYIVLMEEIAEDDPEEIFEEPIAATTQQKVDSVIPTQSFQETVTLPASKKEKWNIALWGGVAVGYTTFSCSGVSPKPGMGFGAHIAAQVFKGIEHQEQLKGYFAEASIGYACKGSGAFPLHSAILRLLPIGYRFGMFNIKAGGFASVPFNGFDTYDGKYDSNTDYGVTGGIGVEFGKLGMSATYEYGFADVGRDTSVELNSQAAFLTVSYRLF